MSRELGLAVLKQAYRGDRIPVMEHPRGLSREAIVHFSGIDPLAEPYRLNEAFLRVAEAFQIDLIWGGGLPGDVANPNSALGAEMFDWSDGQTVKRTRTGLQVVQWGIFGAAHQQDGRHFVNIPKPESADEALAFQPLQWFPDTVEQYRQRFQQEHLAMLQSCGDTCVPIPHHYTTAFHFPLAIFGFELLCQAGMEEPRFSKLMERFAEISLRVTTAWSQLDGVAGFICHDDLTMTSGPIFPPEWYRRHIFPHYREIFRPLIDRGIPLIFTSDGDCSVFVDDIFAAGADGLNFEYMVDLARLVRDYPEKLLIGNINSGAIARGPAERIRHEALRCIETGRSAHRFILNVGGGLTHDMPVAHLEEYLRVSRPALLR